MRDEGAFDSRELRESYELCAAQVREVIAPMWRATESLPSTIRPHVHAVHGFLVRTDHIADENDSSVERERLLVRWRDETFEELRIGRSDHPLRRAYVDTVLRWEVDHGVIEEFFEAMVADCVSPPVFETFADQRRYLRGVAGTVFEMWAPMVGARTPEAKAAISALGEVCQMVDVFEDLPADLTAGRCYLPRADLRESGLGPDDLRRGDRLEALDELVAVQLDRWRDLLELAAPVPGMVDPECHVFLRGLLLGAHLQFDEVALRRSQVFTDGIEPLVSAEGVVRRPARPQTGGVPDHVAVIMDGNRRWAAARGLPPHQGHHAGEWAAVRLVNAALRLGVRHLSIYAFSTENWQRSQEELGALFESLGDGIALGIEWLHELGVRVRWCGRRDRLEPSLASSLMLVESMTSNNDVLSLTLCLDYGGREELVGAARALAAEAVAGTILPEEIGPADLARNLYVPDLPDVDLLIRTSGEQRISNFLPWHLAYAEMVFDPTPWPDFDLERLRQAITAYSGRRRRFGGGLPHPTRSAEPARFT
ncbi:polyprenyl diphosphate synthase [Streptomyces sp. ST2-7A]|uniref:polyprenyl diphosphate synthase n=1 Tax=Streptomyces sp. ST2-7A TaxID=2907214 RepID=UPI001EFFC6B4|nr:polyprenyl diphosphate synthase [Streptomyces sp. ST2-7A]MCE7079544.1 polyprenyl diphosphate synthase [Streptomyces sp. ST2-7A]